MNDTTAIISAIDGGIISSSPPTTPPIISAVLILNPEPAPMYIQCSFICTLLSSYIYRGGVEGPAGTANAAPLYWKVRRCRTTFGNDRSCGVRTCAIIKIKQASCIACKQGYYYIS